MTDPLGARGADLTIDFHDWPNRQEWITWMHRMIGHARVTIPGAVIADDDARTVTYTGFHLDDGVNYNGLHHRHQCPDPLAPSTYASLHNVCFQVVTVQLESPALPFPPTGKASPST